MSMTKEERLAAVRAAWKLRPAAQPLKEFDIEQGRLLGCTDQKVARMRKAMHLHLDPRAMRPDRIAKRLAGLEHVDVSVLVAARKLSDVPNEALDAEIKSRGKPGILRDRLERGARLDGDALDREMSRRGMSKGQLAASAGVHAGNVWRLRKQKRKPTLNTITRLARALNCDPMVLLRDPS